MEVFFVDFEMFVEVIDPVCQDSDLYLRGTGVAFFELIIFDYLFFDFFGYHNILLIIRPLPCAASDIRLTKQKV